MAYRETLDFLLHDWLHVESLTARPRFADHSRETFAAVLDTCERIAREKFAPFARTSDVEEPRFDGERVHLPAASHAAAAAYAESGMLAAAQDYEHGGMQLPCVVEMAANSFFSKAGIGVGGGARGRLAACRYFFRYELPKIGAWLGVVRSRDDTCRRMAVQSF